MGKAGLVQINYFKFLLDELGSRGSNTGKLLKSSGLDRFDLDSPDNYVPASAMYRLFDGINRQEGISDFIAAFHRCINHQNLQNLGDFFLSGHDILSAANFSVKYASLAFTSETDSLEIEGPLSTFRINLGDHSAAGKNHLVELQLALSLSHFQMACGKEWGPLEIDVPMHYAPDLGHLLPDSSAVRVRVNQSEIALRFPTSILNKAFRFQKESAPNAGLPEFRTLTQKIEHLLESSQMGFIPTITLMSEWLETSPRSLQRRLREEETTYAEIVDQWRFKSALDQLSDPHLPVKEISQRLGYLKAQNFNRAFRRWTDTAPERYRELM